MPIRHRIPNLFTLYMVDVFCCALGCVILLWLASARDAQRKGAAHEQAAKLLTDTRLRLASSQGEVTALQSARATVEQERDRLRGKLLTARGERTALTQRLADAEKQHAAARAELAKAQEQAGRLRNDLREAGTRGTELTARLKEAEARARELGRRVAMLAESANGYRAQLAALESRSGTLAKDLERRDREADEAGRRLHDLQSARTKLERQLADRGKELADARRTVAALEERAKALTGQVQTVRAEASLRFAGISLTGRRVVFLVDVSGSMRMRDPSTEDRTKWPTVCEVFGRLMASLPDLKQYQVIVFSDKFSYPLGRPGEWLDFDPKASVPATVERLKRVVPQGETNMSAAFAEVFRYRALDMDTIYLLSDGLPNVGDGLPAKAAGLKGTDKADYLSRYVRATLKTWWNRALPGRPRVRINTIGFFFDSPDVGAFLWALARENDGSFVGMSRP